MTNTEWKKGYEEGFAAGWKAAKNDKDTNCKNYPSTVSYNETMAGVFAMNARNTMLDSGVPPQKTYNLTDHTRIV